MSRRSAASLEVTTTALPFRPGVPADLTPAQAAIWQDVVDSKPAEWFGKDSVPVLKEYVRACTLADELELRVRHALEGGDMAAVRVVADMRDKESKRVASLATKLRLTQQSRYTPQAASTANKKAAGRRPWERS